MAIPAHLAAWRRHGLVNAAILGSGLAGILLAVACLQIILPVERHPIRAQPLYWLVLVPAAAWAAAAANFKVWAVRWFLRVTMALAAAGLLMFGALALGMENGDFGHAKVLALIAAVLATAATAIGWRPVFRQFVAESKRARR